MLKLKFKSDFSAFLHDESLVLNKSKIHLHQPFALLLKFKNLLGVIFCYFTIKQKSGSTININRAQTFLQCLSTFKSVANITVIALALVARFSVKAFASLRSCLFT